MNIRQIIRQKRRQLSHHERQVAQQDIYRKITHHADVNSAQNIAIFLPFDGEIDTLPIIEYLWQQNKSVYLPVIHPFDTKHLLFLHYTPNTPLSKNQFGISQPALNVLTVIPYQKLDIIFTPLVAFDERGYRMGMGGGYYDRLLENYRIYNIKPIGLAFACQKVERINNQPWDVRLPEIIYA